MSQEDNKVARKVSKKEENTKTFILLLPIWGKRSFDFLFS